MDQGKQENKHEKLKKYFDKIKQNKNATELYDYTLNNYNSMQNFELFIEKCIILDHNPNMAYF